MVGLARANDERPMGSPPVPLASPASNPGRTLSLEPDDDSTAFRIRQASPRQPIEGADRAIAWVTMRAIQTMVGESVDTGQPDLYEPEHARVEADLECGGWWPRRDYVLVSDRPRRGESVIGWPDGWSLPFEA